MSALKKNSVIYFASFLYLLLVGYLAFQNQEFLALGSIGLLAMYFAIFHTNSTFLGLAFFAPLSVNIEQWTKGFGLFIPTEPILFGLLILLLFQQLNGSKPIKTYVWRHPIVLAVFFYLSWTFITTISSTHPIVSLKFLLVKLWFIIPLLLFGVTVFQKVANRTKFLWLLLLGMSVSIVYTLIVHAGYNFGEKEGHWVMWPFFKDHTIYGSLIAFVLPLAVGLYLHKKHSLPTQMLLITLIGIVLVGLYFSYTRAAWLSVVAALGVWGLIRFKIKFSWLVGLGLFLGAIIFISWDQIQMEMARNDSEHTTENFGERIQSAANVTTDASNLERLNRWSCAWEMFKERPVMGFGPGTYAFEYARFQHSENLTIISTSNGDMGNAHSEYLGPLAEMGVLGLISMLLIVSAIFYKAITLYQKWPEEDRSNRILILSMILSLVTYFVHGVLNNYLDTDKASVPIWGVCAILIAMERQLVLRNR